MPATVIVPRALIGWAAAGHHSGDRGLPSSWKVDTSVCRMFPPHNSISPRTASGDNVMSLYIPQDPVRPEGFPEMLCLFYFSC
ncbi:hypothetical protein DFH07DRAFT_807131 [Mycena maculata]|uniref:Uncharacterized protein n=1 Tax=Mycena maculata TaxID=230809 RepID=A0AAD7JPF3_9AGAR|nr:hypothetical protein DFH07DRAFT_807131 [Mycena maculata]